MNRRTLLMTGACAVSVGRAVAASTLDPVRDLPQIYRKLAWAADEKVHFWWMRGTRYGVVDSVMTPLWEMHIGTIFSTRTLDADRFEVTAIDANWYTDRATGRLLETFANPYTGATLKVPYAQPTPRKRVYDRTGLNLPITRPGYRITRTGATGPAWIEGDTIWVRGDTALRGEPANGGRPFQINDLYTYSGVLRDVASPRNTNPAATVSFSDINTWPDWLEMGDRPGSYISRCFGRKVERVEDMPAIWREIAAEKAPALVKDPAGALKA